MLEACYLGVQPNPLHSERSACSACQGPWACAPFQVTSTSHRRRWTPTGRGRTPCSSSSHTPCGCSACWTGPSRTYSAKCTPAGAARCLPLAVLCVRHARLQTCHKHMQPQLLARGLSTSSVWRAGSHHTYTQWSNDAVRGDDRGSRLDLILAAPAAFAECFVAADVMTDFYGSDMRRSGRICSWLSRCSRRPLCRSSLRAFCFQVRR